MLSKKWLRAGRQILEFRASHRPSISYPKTASSVRVGDDPGSTQIQEAFLRTNPAIVTDALLVGFLATHPLQL